jgi:RNA 3'-terminal phosphate cyclase-like protein
MELKIKKRGAPPKGGGLVIFTSTNVSELTPVQFMQPGVVKQVRGIAFSTRVTPQTSNRVVESSKEILKQFCGKVYINTDHYKGADSGL